ncbi:hypothetical protein, partial [Rhizobium sp.]|uniref:hypothetical protein n=1 Tax=Rhizobium sp. TaxID=391 RepID=UPI002AA79A84
FEPYAIALPLVGRVGEGSLFLRRVLWYNLNLTDSRKPKFVRCYNFLFSYRTERRFVVYRFNPGDPSAAVEKQVWSEF